MTNLTARKNKLAEESKEQTIYNQAGDKVGMAVWSGRWSDGIFMVGWDCYSLADHWVGEGYTLMAARDILNGFE